MPFEFVNSLYPNRLTSFVCREFGSIDMLAFILPRRRSVINFDWNGNIKKAFFGSDKSAGGITHAIKIGDYLYLGSVTTVFIARVRIGN